MIFRKTRSRKKSKGKSFFYRFCLWLHLWLGLISGIVVIVVSLTGAVLVFEDELRLALQPYQTVVNSENEFLPPSTLAESVKNEYNIDGVSSVIYRGSKRSAIIPWYGDRENQVVNFVNPYTAEPLKQQYLDRDFFRQMVVGHYQLWLPRNIGKPIVAYATLIFVIALLTGLVLWWPKKWTKKSLRKTLTIKWRAKFKKLNYDLHNVLGFYSLIIAVILSLSGMIYGMNWFSDASYWIASQGEAKPEFKRFKSDTTAVGSPSKKDEDILFEKIITSGFNTDTGQLAIYYPYGKQGVWGTELNTNPKTRWQSINRSYEQGSLKLLKEDEEFSKLNGGDQLLKVNYDIHVGSIGGLTTKIMAFLVCLISAGLPITGFIIWWKRSKKKRLKALRFPKV